MALPEIQIKEQLQLTNGALAPIDAPRAIEAPPVARIARYNPYEELKGHGIRGWLRAFHIISTFAIYHVFVYAYHRGWFIGKKDESEEKHLQWQAEWSSRRLLRPGPTFIKGP